jgi:hypothetical protein
MADRQVAATTKADGEVKALGGPWGVRTKAAASIDIQNHAHTYYVLIGGIKLPVIVVKADDGRFLRTAEDFSAPDPLHELPDIDN